jgi:hypothetical protein
MKYKFLMMIVLTLGLTALVACNSGVGNDGDLVGGPCVSNADCEERCLTGGDYPQGTCSVSCTTDRDCPDTTYCIDKEGGTCMLGCNLPSDCRNGYTCKGKDNNGHGGESLVCYKD